MSGIQAPLDCETCQLGYNNDPLNADYGMIGKGMWAEERFIQQADDTSGEWPSPSSGGPEYAYAWWKPGNSHTARNLRGIPRRGCQPVAGTPCADVDRKKCGNNTNDYNNEACHTWDVHNHSQNGAHQVYWWNAYASRNKANYNSDPRLPGKCSLHHSYRTGYIQTFFNNEKLFHNDPNFGTSPHRKQHSIFRKNINYWPNGYFSPPSYIVSTCEGEQGVGTCCYNDDGNWIQVPNCVSEEVCMNLHNHPDEPYQYTDGVTPDPSTPCPMPGFRGSGGTPPANPRPGGLDGGSPASQWYQLMRNCTHSGNSEDPQRVCWECIGLEGDEHGIMDDCIQSCNGNVACERRCRCIAADALLDCIELYSYGKPEPKKQRQRRELACKEFCQNCNSEYNLERQEKCCSGGNSSRNKSMRGSCCYLNDEGKSTVEENITFDACQSLDGIHSTRSKKERIQNRELFCCHTCNVVTPESRKQVGKNPENKMFRSRVGNQVIASNTKSTDKTLKTLLSECHSCNNISSVDLSACKKVANLIEIYRKEANRLCDNAKNSIDAEHKSYYRCKCTSMTEMIDNMKMTFGTHSCKQSKKTDINDTPLIKTVNSLIDNYKRIEETCSSYISKEFHEEDLVLGSCCQYMKPGKTETQELQNGERVYSQGQLRKCTYTDKMTCLTFEDVYDTKFHKCIGGDCSSSSRDTGTPETCDLCNRNFDGGLVKNPSDLPKETGGGKSRRSGKIEGGERGSGSSTNTTPRSSGGSSSSSGGGSMNSGSGSGY